MVGGDIQGRGLGECKGPEAGGSRTVEEWRKPESLESETERRGWTGSRAEQTQAEPAGSGDKKDTLPKWGHVGMKDMVIFTLGQKMGMVLANSDV